jgi:hypothetical protein
MHERGIVFNHGGFVVVGSYILGKCKSADRTPVKRQAHSHTLAAHLACIKFSMIFIAGRAHLLRAGDPFFNEFGCIMRDQTRRKRQALNLLTLVPTRGFSWFSAVENRYKVRKLVLLLRTWFEDIHEQTLVGANTPPHALCIVCFDVRCKRHAFGW